MKAFPYLYLLVLFVVLPYTLHAQVTVVTILQAFTKSFSLASGLLVSVALLVFLWGVVVFITNAGDEKARSEGRTKILWGIVGLAVIVSMWGVVNLLRTMVGTTNIPKCTSPDALTMTECLP